MKKSVKLTVLLALVTALTACSSQPKNAPTAAGTGEPEKNSGSFPKRTDGRSRQFYADGCVPDGSGQFRSSQ